MSANAALRAAQVARVLLVDDDLARTVSLADLDVHGEGARYSQVLADADHDFSVALDALLAEHRLPATSSADRLAGLSNAAVLGASPAPLRAAYQRAIEQRTEQRQPLAKIKAWIEEGGGVVVDEWTESRDLPGSDRYDLLVVDYYLVNHDPTATIQLINRLKDLHANQPRPLLVILMSSNIADIERDFEKIRDQCQMSASRFRILAKPVTTNQDAEAVVREKWFRALRQLASERSVVAPIEAFVKAWEHSLRDAATQMIERLYDMDASAFALLAATADQDSMTIEEYLADVLARRISAATEEKSFPFNEIAALQASLEAAKTMIGPTIDQGVEVRHAQRAIRGLMSDVVWHRPPWWRPRSAAPAIVAPMAASMADGTSSPEAVATPQVPAVGEGDAAIPSVAEDQPSANAGPVPDAPPAAAENPGRTEERLKWLKRNVRFGTVLRMRSNRERFIVNLTQACDIQSEKLANVGEVNYLFLQGKRFPVDRVAVGEKLFDSPYYREESEDDDFFTLQWRLRQPFTPPIGELLDELENYEIVGQLRSESAYAILAKYMSQATRVAQLRMPKMYRYEISVYHKQADDSWRSQALAQPIEASAWQKDNSDWRLQFTVDAATALLPSLSGIDAARRDQFVAALTSGLKVESKSGTDLYAREIGETTILLIRVDGKAEYDASVLSGRIASTERGKAATAGATAIVARALT